jgi:hypothetical protein
VLYFVFLLLKYQLSHKKTRKVENPPQQVNAPIEVRNVHLELNKQTLETMLDGLGKIKNQLAGLQ